MQLGELKEKWCLRWQLCVAVVMWWQSELWVRLCLIRYCLAIYRRELAIRRCEAADIELARLETYWAEEPFDDPSSFDCRSGTLRIRSGEEATEMTEPQEATRDERRWAMLAHALTLAGWVIPLANLLFPALVGWSNRDSAYVQCHARASLRFQVSCLFCELAGLGLVGVFFRMSERYAEGLWIGHYLLGLAMVSLGLLALVWVFAVIGLVLHASVRAHAGVHYRYPFTLRFLR